MKPSLVSVALSVILGLALCWVLGQQAQLFGKTERLEHLISDLRADVRALAENEEDHDYRLAVIEPILKLAVEED